ncbi:hypothetical protein GCM10009827_069900 [Dactylosporangium maewongense]|uniref:Uncharacterized protein n=1 Tax=Dactylosporangium maewongense TaxID=634393 RepID=A0ABN2BHQ1_9ACTN
MVDEGRGRASRELVYHSPDALIPPPWPPQEGFDPPGPGDASGIREPRRPGPRDGGPSTGGALLASEPIDHG